ncbi:hypothetical protein HaLaN_23638 [Haematococcus lacustris]|uniref:Uncharacterized protein n=1 Tax=Haematococcus lacustris TaxID=44745 RepID=A0A699ZTG3_HAELA|nr:hypothetical protein HaLaN_23638 [Haematococcus lacustris]
MTAKSRIVFMSSEGEWPLAQVEASFKNIKGDTLKESGPVAYGTSKAYEVRGRSPAAAVKPAVAQSQTAACRSGQYPWSRQDGQEALPECMVSIAPRRRQVSAMGKLLGQNQYHGEWVPGHRRNNDTARV